MVETIAIDVLVIGGGGAASRAAVEAARAGVSVALVDKGAFGASGSSPTSLFGLAAPLGGDDTPELLFSDLVADGCEMSDQNLAWAAASGAEENARQLEAMGYQYMRKADGSYACYKGVGHSAHRGLQFVRAQTGLDPVAMLGREAWRLGVKLCDRIAITRLLKKDNAVVGAVGVSPDGKGYLFKTKAIVLAAGGANHLYPNAAMYIADRKYRTTGDALCLAFDAGVPLIDIEFTNFREGEGAGTLPKLGSWLLNNKGERIMEKYAPKMMERSPRGKLVEAIYTENTQGRGPVEWLLPKTVDDEYVAGLKVFRKRWDVQDRMKAGIDFQRLLGGARINEKTETNVAGLYAAGESAGGFHGADRMQAASFLEVTFFGAAAGRNAAAYAGNRGSVRVDARTAEKELASLVRFNGAVDPEQVITEVQQTMWENVSIVRNAAGIKRTLSVIDDIQKNKLPKLSGKDLHAAISACNLASIAEMVSKAALEREETRGTHRRSDFPKQDDQNWHKHVAINSRNGQIDIGALPVVIRS